MKEKIMISTVFTVLFGSVTVLILALSTDIFEKSEFVKTGLTLDGYDIVTYADWYKDTEYYKKYSEPCDIYIYDNGGIEYYYESEFCIEPLFEGDYQVNVDNSYTSLAYYVFWNYPRISERELISLGFVKKRQMDYVESGITIRAFGVETLYTHSTEYYSNNIDCMVEREIVLYEDDDYEYIYKSETCDSGTTEHLVRVGAYDPINYNYLGIYFISLDYYIESNKDILTWCDIEATGLGIKVSKS